MRIPYNVSVGFVGTYPPTVCGIATFTASMVNALVAQHPHDGRGRVGVVSLTDRNVGVAGPPVVFHHRIGDAGSLRGAIEALSAYDTVSIQHEFGIFGGRDGDEVIDLMSGLTVPTAVTLHTVLAEPTTHQRAIVERMCQAASRMVVMSQTAADRLAGEYTMDPGRIRLIPHGADPEFAGRSRSTGDRPLILTWGLIGPGKGLEWAIEACSGLLDLEPLPRYLILGSTHPQVRQASGESYRDSLTSLARRLGVDSIVEFDDRHLTRKALARMVRSADIVVLPYESMEQVTSGVLVEAVAAAKPVVATPFPHAVELLSGGAGIIFPHRDAAALSDALRELLTYPDRMADMTQRARRVAEGMYWPSVALKFAETMSEMAEGSGMGSPLVASGRRAAG